MRKFSADLILPISSKPLKGAVLVIDDNGKILSIDKLENHDRGSVEYFEGVLVPGFVNAHCHLELSHMKGRVDTGTGLLPFIKGVVSLREVEQEKVLAAIKAADEEMHENGIVAVGDICNKADTAAQKRKSKINYYSFVEMFDFLQDARSEEIFNQYHQVYLAQSGGEFGNKKSCVPHAPYSVSKSLFSRINQVNKKDRVVSIHNQETPSENALFLNKGGGFPDLFGGFMVNLDSFEPTGKTAIHYAIENMDPDCKTLFVHNTLSTPDDIQAAHNWNKNVFWATCPNANLYIENRLPNYKYFIDAKAQMTIGTDSLTSNWQLSILEEMKTITRHQSYITFETVLEWATLNGARALNYEDQLGSFEVGKTPGVNLLNLDAQNLLLTEETKTKRLI